MKLMVLAAFAAVAFAPSADATISNMVTNGDFTQLSNGLGQFDVNTVATGWTNERDAGDNGYNFVMNNATSGSSGVSGNVSLWTAANGGSSTWDGKTASGSGNFAALDGAYFTGPLSQTVSGLVVGQAYTLSFNYAFGQQQGFSGDTIQSIDASIGAAGQFTRWNSGDFELSDHGFSGWSKATVDFTATSASEVLSFYAHGNLPVPPFALVSNVSIPAVPEMQVWGMMILGLGAVGLTVRRRQAAMLAAA